MAKESSRRNYTNYIYLKYYNYLTYEKGNLADEVFSKTRDNLKKQFKTRKIRSSDSATIEKRLNYFFSAKKGQHITNSKMSPEVADAIFQGAINYVQSNLGPGKQIAVTNTLSGGFGQYEQQYNQKLSKLDTKTSQQRNTINELIKKLDNIRQNTTNKNLSARIKQLDALWLQIKDKKGYTTSSDFKMFQKEYNDLVDDMFKKDSNITGQIGEAIVAAIMMLNNYTAEQVIGLTADQVMQSLTQAFKNNKGVVGSVISQKGFNPSQLLSGKMTQKDIEAIFSDMDFTSLNYNGENIDFMFNQIGTQNKVDVVFDFKNTELNATIKNYDLSSYYTKKNGIKLVSGTSLFVLLSRETQFLQHYLNITSEHGYTDTEQLNGLQKEPPEALLAEAHRTMRQLIFARGLAGGVISNSLNNNDEANLFIINDNSTGRFRVYFVQDLINKVMENYSLARINSSTKDSKNGIDIDGYPESLSYKYEINGWEKWPQDGKARMKHLYAQLAKQKIYASLDYSALDISKI